MTRLKSLLAAVALGATALTATVALSQPAARQRVAAPRAPLSAEDKALVDKAAAYLQGLTSAKGEFIQTDARGRTSRGTFYLQRPGKARFEYAPPSGLLIVADGSNVNVQDRRLKTFDRYPLGSTPLTLFLSRKIRLSEGVEVTRVLRSADGFQLFARDGKRQAEGSIILAFAGNPMRLTEWTITDAQGGRTRVQLTSLAPASGLSPSLFVLRDPNRRPERS
ncbi:MAG: outer membrane lipoprotein carrier protein LolA [Caulobacteraceae bacterium]|nr:outer membrane lipoprotein carrier protein LolA [Caulobacteraceae bacterium]